MNEDYKELWSHIVYAVSVLVFNKSDSVTQRFVSAALKNTHDLYDNVQFYMTGKFPDDPETDNDK